MSLIGSLVIRTSVNTNQLGSGFKKAATSVTGFTSTVKVAGASLTALAITAAGILGPIIAISKVISGVSSALQGLDRLGKFADETGLAVDELRGLQLGAELSGTSVENLEKGTQRLTRRLGEAKLGFGEGKRALEQLGLKADELTKISVFDALKRVADQIKAQKTPAEQAAAAYTLFGRQGQEMLTFLNSGSKGMDEFVKRAKELGGSLSRVDIRQVEAANDAITEIKFTFKSVFQQLAISFAPLITALVRNFQQLGFTGKSSGDFIITAMEFVAKGVAVAVDAVQGFRIAWLFVKKWALEAVAAIVESVALMLKKIENALNKIPKVSIDITSGIDGAAKSLRKMATDAGKILDTELVKKSAGEKFTEFFRKIRADSKLAAEEMERNAKKGFNPLIEGMLKATEAAGKLVQKLKDQIASFGMSSTEAEIFKLKQQGASVAMLGQARAAAKQLKALEDSKKSQEDLAAKAKAVFADTATPLEKFQDKLADLKELFDQGLIGDDTFKRAILKAQREFEKPAKAFEVKFAGVAEAGSSEARSAILRSRFGTADQQPINKISDNTKNMLMEMKIQTRVLQRIDDRKVENVSISGA